MKNILAKTACSIIPISSNIFAIIRLNDFIVYDNNSQTMISRSPIMRNISTVMFDEQKNILFAVDTGGRIIVLGEKPTKTKTKIRGDTQNRHWFVKNNIFHCVDDKGKLITLCENGEKGSTIFFDKSIDAVFKHSDKVYVVSLKRNSVLDSLDVTSEIYECVLFDEQLKSLKLIYKDNGFIDEIKQDINNISTSILLDKANGIGRKKELVLFPRDDFQTHIVLDLSDIEHRFKKNRIFYNYATNIDNSLVALLFFDEIIVWDYRNQEVTYREKIENGTDIVWISDDKLLLTSCSGLFEINLQSRYNNQGTSEESNK